LERVRPCATHGTTFFGVNLAGKLIASAGMAEGLQPVQVASPSDEVRNICESLYKDAQAHRYGLTQEVFQSSLLEVARRYVPGATDQELISFLRGLRCEELALARGCAEGSEAAWEVFMTRYRSSLYGSAYAVTRDESVGRELADLLYAELFGVPKENGQRVSKLKYYMGRGSLEGWLRTVLAQEYVNRYRRTRHEVSLEERVESGVQFEAREAPAESAVDDKVQAAVGDTLSALESEERFLLSAYYLDGRTLAEIGRVLRVHESTVSRKLERLVTSLRKELRKKLVASGMSLRQADEAMQEVDVRDLNVNVRAGLQQEVQTEPFYKSEKQRGPSQ
jgi:RNA polymerase sigma-70 factor, ECF subfamily